MTGQVDHSVYHLPHALSIAIHLLSYQSPQYAVDVRHPPYVVSITLFTNHLLPKSESAFSKLVQAASKIYYAL